MQFTCQCGADRLDAMQKQGASSSPGWSSLTLIWDIQLKKEKKKKNKMAAVIDQNSHFTSFTKLKRVSYV